MEIGYQNVGSSAVIQVSYASAAALDKGRDKHAEGFQLVAQDCTANLIVLDKQHPHVVPEERRHFVRL